MSGLDLRTIARALGGEVTGRQVLAPGPNHSRSDRSLSVRLSAQSPTGFIVFSHAGDDFRDARDYVAAKLGLGPDAWKRVRQSGEPTAARSQLGEWHNAPAKLADASDNAARIARARAVWDGTGPATGSLVQAYLASRGLDLPDGCRGAPLPPTMPLARRGREPHHLRPGHGRGAPADRGRRDHRHSPDAPDTRGREGRSPDARAGQRRGRQARCG